MQDRIFPIYIFLLGQKLTGQTSLEVKVYSEQIFPSFFIPIRTEISRTEFFLLYFHLGQKSEVQKTWFLNLVAGQNNQDRKFTDN